MVRICMFLLMVLVLVQPSFAKSYESKKPARAVKTVYPVITLHDHIRIFCKRDCVEQEVLLDSVHRAATALRVDFKVLLAIIQVESAFNPRAKNGSSVGLNQVNLRYHRKRFTPGNYYDVRENVLAGAAVYKECLIKSKGNKSLALRCYNGYHLGDPNYVTKVTKAYEQINRLIDLDRRKLTVKPVGPISEL